MKNGKPRDTGNIGYTILRATKNKTYFKKTTEKTKNMKNTDAVNTTGVKPGILIRYPLCNHIIKLWR